VFGGGDEESGIAKRRRSRRSRRLEVGHQETTRQASKLGEPN
jgi:hypothetical protein